MINEGRWARCRSPSLALFLAADKHRHTATKQYYSSGHPPSDRSVANHASIRQSDLALHLDFPPVHVHDSELRFANDRTNGQKQKVDVAASHFTAVHG